MTVQEQLQALVQRYSLPKGWSLPELFVERAVVDELSVELCGLLSRDTEGREVTGSAGECGAVPVQRAYLELIERISTVAAATAGHARFLTLDAHGEPGAAIDAARVFPEAPPGSSYRYSLSNGVAAAPTFVQAAKAACGELVERDRVLRSWFGEIEPVRIEHPALEVLTALGRTYRFEAALLPIPATDPGVDVAVVVGFPKTPEAPLVRGMAASDDRAAAISRAVRECLQNLGFLWGESVPSDQPDPLATADYHQEYYLWPEAHAVLREWLTRPRQKLSLRVPSAPDATVVRYVDLTPAELRGRLSIVKAISEQLLPLVFGVGHPALAEESFARAGVHPIS